MKLVFTRCLLLVYGLAIIHTGMLDMGHTLLHSVKNSIHGHQHSHDHGIHDHHPLIHISSEHDDDVAVLEYGFGLCFLFFEPFVEYTTSTLSTSLLHANFCIGDEHAGYEIPVVRPPLS